MPATPKICMKKNLNQNPEILKSEILKSEILKS